ncbi:multidrug ABC transporter permease [Clostridium carboxidivorans P7]|uniref:ABC transporter permease n=1 Tax=Clostridium carboxidivorans TaxID=217159 RepID=UPI0002EC4FF4|nr:ABC transporter permease [Clostridium carboxidivorans]AKN33478.1 multidrug ABC transporter permease [Clostridium carboxidivorans P7]
MNKQELIKITFAKVKNVGILVLLPIFFTLIFSLVFSKVFVEQIPFGVLDLDNSSTSRTIVRQFEDHPGFKVTYHAGSYDDINEKIKSEKIQAAIIIPKNFGKDVSEMKAPKTILLVNETNIVIGNNALSYGSTILNTLNAKIQLNVLEGNNMMPYLAQQSVSSLSFTERILYDPQLCYGKYLIYGLIAILIQQTYLAVVIPILITEKSNLVKIKLRSKKGIKKMAVVCLRILLSIVFAYIGFILCLYCAGKYFNMPLRGTLINYFRIMTMFIMDLTGVAFVLSFIFNKVPDFNRFSMCLSVPTFLTAGYSWPGYMMPGGFSRIVETLWPVIYAADPLRVISLKGSNMDFLRPYIQQGIHYALVWIPIGILLYLIKIVVLKYMYKKFLNTQKEAA